MKPKQGGFFLDALAGGHRNRKITALLLTVEDTFEAREGRMRLRHGGFFGVRLHSLPKGAGAGFAQAGLALGHSLRTVMKKHWFFDFDGTLCDTEADIKVAWRSALAALGRSCPQFDRVYKTGPTLDQVTHMLFSDATPELVEQIRGQFQRFYDTSTFPSTKPYPWIPGWLDDLKRRGCCIYVATNKRYAPLRPLMAKLAWADFFDGFYAFDMYPGERLKKADLLLRVMRERGIDPADAVMVGDTAGDVEAGRIAGLATIGCTWGYGTREELEDADEIYDESRFS